MVDAVFHKMTVTAHVTQHESPRVPVRLPLGCVGDPWDLEKTGCRLNDGALCTNCTHSLSVTGIRYAWGESPCCPNWGSIATIPCEPNS